MNVFHHWKDHISGWKLAAIGIVVSVVAAIFVRNAVASTVIVIASALVVVGAAVLFMLVNAQYDAWKDERQKLEEERVKRQEAEAKLDASADIRGTIWVSASPRPMLMSVAVHQPPIPAVLLIFRFDCANHGRKACQISKVHLSATLDGKQLLTMGELEQLPPDKMKTIRHGEGFVESYPCTVAEIPIADLPRVVLDAYLVDSLGVHYPNIKTVTNFSAAATY